MRFDKKTGDLYIADAYFGLLKVGPEGGQAVPLVTEAEGGPLRFTNDLDIDEDGNIYFTDSSTKYQRRYVYMLLKELHINYCYSRLYKYQKQQLVKFASLIIPKTFSMQHVVQS